MRDVSMAARFGFGSSSKGGRQMRKVLMAAAALVAMAGAAQCADQTISLTANVNASCIFESGSSRTGTINLGSVGSGDAIPFNEPVPLSGVSGDVTGVVNCTGPATITLTSANKGLKHENDPPSIPAANKIQYTARANIGTLGAGNPELNTFSEADGTVTGTSIAHSGGPRNLLVSVNLNGGETSLRAGNYTDTLTVTVNPS
jgi:spore coat protein U-like protein